VSLRPKRRRRNYWRALPGVPIKVEASHAARGLVLRASVPAPAAEMARAELGKLPVGFEIAAE
jgi:hypothetical protein